MPLLLLLSHQLRSLPSTMLLLLLLLTVPWPSHRRCGCCCCCQRCLSQPSFCPALPALYLLCGQLCALLVHLLPMLLPLNALTGHFQKHAVQGKGALQQATRGREVKGAEPYTEKGRATKGGNMRVHMNATDSHTKGCLRLLQTQLSKQVWRTTWKLTARPQQLQRPCTVWCCSVCSSTANLSCCTCIDAR